MNEIIRGVREVYAASARGETMDFACKCGGAHNAIPSAVFLEFGEPDCPKCGEPMPLVKVTPPADTGAME